ncbi:uncharacterized protein LOC143365851 [Halictus rubicundus]|uniref:uncharacterized protein LOC143365851 n=1 Tax=Halictus rubicundus TaxID=77578 RepID=UPI0040360427
MAAPMTELLFLFLLGIASWSCCLAQNTVTITGYSCAPVDGNGVIESFNCSNSDNLLNAKIIVKNRCPGIVQSEMDLVKDGNAVEIIQYTLNSVNDLEIPFSCKTVHGLDPDSDNCPETEGEISVEDCDVTPFFQDIVPGDYDANIRFRANDDVIATVNLEVKVA